AHGRSGAAPFGCPSRSEHADFEGAPAKSRRSLRFRGDYRRPLGAQGQPDRDRRDRSGRVLRERAVEAAARVDPAARDRAPAGHVRAAAGAVQAALLQGPQAARRHQAAPGPGPAGTAQFCSGLGRGVSRGGVGLLDPGAFHRAGASSPGRRSGVRQSGFRLLPRLPDLLPARAQGTSQTVVSAQLWALAVAGAVVLAAAGLETLRSRMARRAVATGSPSGPAGHVPMNGAEPYIIYFTGDT